MLVDGNYSFQRADVDLVMKHFQSSNPIKPDEWISAKDSGVDNFFGNEFHKKSTEPTGEVPLETVWTLVYSYLVCS